MNPWPTMFLSWLTMYSVSISSPAKKKNKKGKTLTLTDFLAEDKGGSNAPPSYPAKSTSWADETDELEGDGECTLKYKKKSLPSIPCVCLAFCHLTILGSISSLYCLCCLIVEWKWKMH